MGGSDASKARFCRARSIICTSRRPAGNCPLANVMLASFRSSGSSPSLTTKSGVYGSVCAAPSRYIDCTPESFAADSAAGAGADSASLAVSWEKSTSGGCMFIKGMIGRLWYL
eukprot:scaffold11172_cov122-Isochrysis_galbana.AAC.3